MDWIEVTISTNTEGADIVSEALMRQGAVGTQIIDRSDVPDPDKPNGYWELIDRKMLDEMPEDVQVKAWFSTVEELRAAVAESKKSDVSTLIEIMVLPGTMTGGYENFWRVGTASVAEKESVREAYEKLNEVVKTLRKY
mgnify:CR=1 FL=1